MSYSELPGGCHVQPRGASRLTQPFNPLTACLGKVRNVLECFTREPKVKGYKRLVNHHEFERERGEMVSLDHHIVETAQDCSGPQHLDLFLLKMLGDLFQIDVEVIRQVVGVCTDSPTEAIQKLIHLSPITSAKSNDVVDCSSGQAIQKLIHLSHRTSTKSTDIVDDSSEQAIQKLIHPSPITSTKSNDTIDDSSGQAIQKLIHPSSITSTKSNDIVDGSSGQAIQKLIHPSPSTSTKSNDEAIQKLIHPSPITSTKSNDIVDGSSGQASQVVAQTSAPNMEKEEHVTLDLHDLDLAQSLHSLYKCLDEFPPGPQRLKVIVGDSVSTHGRRKKGIITSLELRLIWWTEEENGRVFVIQENQIRHHQWQNQQFEEKCRRRRYCNHCNKCSC